MSHTLGRIFDKLVIPAFSRQRQEELKFEASLGFVARPYLKITQPNKNTSIL
jgi:hypothetical protein